MLVHYSRIVLRQVAKEDIRGTEVEGVQHFLADAKVLESLIFLVLVHLLPVSADIFDYDLRHLQIGHLVLGNPKYLGYHRKG